MWDLHAPSLRTHLFCCILRFYSLKSKILPGLPSRPHHLAKAQHNDARAPKRTHAPPQRLSPQNALPPERSLRPSGGKVIHTVQPQLPRGSRGVGSSGSGSGSMDPYCGWEWSSPLARCPELVSKHVHFHSPGYHQNRSE